MSIHGQNIDVELLDSIINSIKVSGFIFIDGQKVSAQDIINQVKTVKSLLKRAKWANQTIADQKKLIGQLVEALEEIEMHHGLPHRQRKICRKTVDICYEALEAARKAGE